LGAVPRVYMSVSLRPVCGGKWTFRRFPEGVANSGKKSVAIPSHIFRRRCVLPIKPAVKQRSVNQEKGPGDDTGPDSDRFGPPDQNLIFSDVEIAVTRSLSKS
jgi:hypothetical protein